jgi:hypothetical protein
MPFGPYHRLRSPTQDEEVAKRQVSEGRLLGRAAVWSNLLSVKAYHGRLPRDEEGIEFTTFVVPSRANHPSMVFWDAGSDGVPVITENGVDFAMIRVRVTRFVYVKP